MGMAPVAAVTDLGHTAYMDSKMRKTGNNRETICSTHVRFITDWQIFGAQSSLWRWERCKNWGNDFCYLEYMYIYDWKKSQFI